ncbi:retroviral-like aspartic protease family protein [Candidatus Synechococcus calcipolaris G9]|uniref:Retroviral-like aspartic protease family protein n=1 Tax=Candidatus Synechococcus calcipolaris G9 TaxID=1497997 RepID=A0ABT6F010_9SYNE|nr:retropepsin-like aspartic protease [Candidatus Synechococcus calcipolaris]MDG2991160.1 retroviral-like aspartic protease family protein [Candidatus Synechococcus calcipolaris G9]
MKAYGLLLCLGLLIPTPVLGQSLGSDALYQAIANQDWARAIQVVDQMIQANPGQANELRRYRQELIQLQQRPPNAQQRPTRPSAQVGTAPIIRRQNGIPVIRVLFNQRLASEMMVDTGASMTVITRPLARALGITPANVVDNAVFNTANGQTVMPIVYVRSLDVAGLNQTMIPVAIAGPELSMGLLGQDFLQQFDLSLRQDHIQFHRRSSGN